MPERERQQTGRPVRQKDRRRLALLVFAAAMLAGPARAEETQSAKAAAPDAVRPAGASPANDAGAAKNGASGVEITSTKTSWDNLNELFFGNTPASPFGEGSVFVMRGELKNSTTHPIHHVVLRYELLDENGKVLHDVEGYNRSAEDMRPDEEGAVHAEKVKPIPAGGTDSYRMVFFHDEVPRFHSQRVRVSEVHEK